VVDAVLDYDVRVSDKAAYRSPTRGAQGNALKTVVGIPYALGREEPVIIEGEGIRHEIQPWIDPAGVLRIEHGKSDAPVDETYKSRVSLTVPWDDQLFDADYWVRAFAMFNPHADIDFDHLQYGGLRCETYKRDVSDGWRKYMPTDLTSAHWYTTAAMKRLVFSHIGHAESNGGRDLPIGKFIRQFRGLSGPKKAKLVRAAVEEFPHLSAFKEHPERVGELLEAMKEHSKSPGHRVFGRVGPEHFEAVFERSYEVLEFNYAWDNSYTPAGLPYIFEIALATTSEPGDLYYGINYTAAFDDPLEGTLLAGPKFKTHGIRGFLQHSHALPQSEGYYSFRSPVNVAVAVHIITPAPVFLDRGKTRIQLSEEEDNRG